MKKIDYDDLKDAVLKNVISEESLVALDQHFGLQAFSEQQPSEVEPIEFLSGFSDVFMTQVTFMVLISTSFIIFQFSNYTTAIAGLSLVSLGTLIFFKHKDKLKTYPLLINLLCLSFLGGLLYFLSVTLTGLLDQNFLICLIAAVTGSSSYLLWKNFKFAIGVAFYSLSLVHLVGYGPILLMNLVDKSLASSLILRIGLLGGLCLIAYGVYFDQQDKARTQIESKVAFWLHLIGSCLFCWCLFKWLNLSMKQINIFQSIFIITIYGILTAVSLVIDRRSLMFSALLLFIYAIYNVFLQFLSVEDARGSKEPSVFALVILICGLLLFYVAYNWVHFRQKLLNLLPPKITDYLR